MKRRIFFALFAAVFTLTASAQKMTLLVGTYTDECSSNGIYAYDYYPANGTAVARSSTEGVVNPSFLTYDPAGFVYSVNEAGADSKASAFTFDKSTAAFRFLGSQPTKGADPCYILADDKNVITANYSGGSLTVFRRNPDGSLSAPAQVIPHRGRGTNPQRQEKSHIHQVQFTPDHKYVVVNDLGTDQIYLYRYYPVAEKGILMLQEAIPVKPGSGPRHLAFSPKGEFAYLLQELDGTITTFSYRNGVFKRLREDSVVPVGFTGQIGAADIHVSPDGRYLYATNRGSANDISIFALGPDGLPQFRKRISTKGEGPRNFAFDPNGNFLLVANQKTGNITVFKVDRITGDLTDTGNTIKVCSPVCLVFVP